MSTLVTQTSATVLIETAATSTVEVITAGPQGAASPPYALSQLPDLDIANPVDNSLLYYDAAASKWKGNNVNTVLTLTDGGAF